jgi:hypothetical protein
MSGAELYTIHCLIESEDNVFSVKLSSNETVEDLKEAIKIKGGQTLADVTAHNLKLYHVEILTHVPNATHIDADYVAEAREEMGKPQLPPELKNPLRELVEVFKGTPPRRTLHIIVRIPSPAQSEKRNSKGRLIASC